MYLNLCYDHVLVSVCPVICCFLVLSFFETCVSYFVRVYLINENSTFLHVFDFMFFCLMSNHSINRAESTSRDGCGNHPRLSLRSEPVPGCACEVHPGTGVVTIPDEGPLVSSGPEPIPDRAPNSSSEQV